MNPTAGSGEDNLRSALNKAELETLETLKIQYFQNATRFLAKGEYDSALAEIKRVLLIDPEHYLAREYELRVTQLQASRVQTPKADPVPQREVPRVSPAAAAMPAPAPVRASRRTALYIAIIGCIVLGTAGIVTFEKGSDEEQPPVTPAAQMVAPQVSAPAEQPAENTLLKEPPPPVQPPATVESKHPLTVAEKSAPRPEPVRRDPPVHPALERDESLSSAESGRPAVLAVKKVEPPPAPVKKEVPDPQPEVKTAASEPPPAEPVHESAPFVAVEKEPRIVLLEKPRLPDIVLRNHISGEVTAKVLIDRDGKPQEVQIVSSTSSVFEQPVIDAITKSSFSPGMMGTGPVAAWVLIPFKFK